MRTFLLALSFSIIIMSMTNAQDIKFPEPDREGGMPLMQALNERHSSREFSSRELPLELMGNLFWAACGSTRGTYRTAPSALNWQEVRAYAVTKDGIYLYHDSGHYLEKHISGDYREYAGLQDFVKDAPLNIIYVADYTRMDDRSEQDKLKYSWADAAFIAQNVYLFCSSENLNTVVRGSVDREVLAEKMQLDDNHKIVLAQTVGFPVD